MGTVKGQVSVKEQRPRIAKLSKSLEHVPQCELGGISQETINEALPLGLFQSKVLLQFAVKHR